MDEERAHWYPDLKTVFLAKFDISPETYRQQFKAMTIPPGENPTETYHHLKGLYWCWTRPEQHTKEQIGETIILEQLLRVLPPEVRTWVKEHEPAEGLTAARLAVQYINARRGGPASCFTSTAPRPTVQPPQPRPRRREYRQEVPGTTTSTAPNQQASGKDFVCFYCQQPGHKASVCPIRKAKVTGACYAPRPEVGPVKRTGQIHHHKTVGINGQQVTALLDTGSFTSLVKHRLVPVGCVDYS
ncbi:zinc finger protein 496-like [Larimichthys crocea]|uniref:zinc finger protein 496-like n=1 Tax=Larimichthys crocea TaxID=215358 RepID=UPI000F5FA345|nr:zinc finger protein 496-like [Larimichthys crocea]